MRRLISKRLILEAIIGTCFIITTVFAVLLAQGNIITPDGTIKETGVIEINSIPDDVQAFLDDKPVSISNHRIQNVLTGKITLRLQKEGYNPWEKVLEVNNDKITYVYAQLYPIDLQRIQIFTQNIDNLVYSQDKSRIIFTVLNSEVQEENGIWKFEFNQNIPLLQNSQPVKIYSFNDDLTNTLRTFPYELSISADNSFALLQVPAIKMLSRINVNASNEAINLIDSIGFYPEHIQWLNNANTFLIKEGNLLYEYKLDTQMRDIIYYDPARAPIFSAGQYGVLFVDYVNNRISYYTNQNVIPVKLPLSTSNDLSTIQDNIAEIDVKKITDIHLSAFNQNIFVAHVDSQALYVNIDSNISRMIPSVESILGIAPDGQSFIFKSNDKIHSFVFDKILNRSNTHVLKNSNEIGNVLYTSSGKQLIEIQTVNNSQTLDVVDIDGNNRVVLVDSIDLRHPLTIFMDNQSKNLYVVLNNSGEEENKNYNLYRIELELE